MAIELNKNDVMEIKTLVETRDVNGFTLEIHADTDPIDPREWDNVGVMACKHSLYKLGDEQIDDPVDWMRDVLGDEPDDEDDEDGDSLDELQQRFLDTHFALALYIYDHGGVTMSTRPFNCPWDSSMVGYIYADVRTVFENWGPDVDEETVFDYLRAEVETYDCYLRGSVYGYVLKAGEEIADSCWGFYGDDFEKNGLLEHATETVPDVAKVRERGELTGLSAEGDEIRKTYAYKPYGILNVWEFEAVEDVVSGRVELNLKTANHEEVQ